MNNKHQESLDRLMCNIGVIRSDYVKSGHAREDIETLQELVERAIPKTPIPLFISMAYMPYRCPVCRSLVNHKKDRFNYCPNCGQAIDWSD